MSSAVPVAVLQLPEFRSHGLMPAAQKSRSSSSTKSMSVKSLGKDLPASARRRPYACPQCNKTFTVTGHLKRHMGTHTGEKKHPCPFPGCDVRCSRKDNLQQHYRRHLCGPRSRAKKKISFPDSASSLEVEPQVVPSNPSPLSPETSTSGSSFFSGYSSPPNTPPPLVEATFPVGPSHYSSTMGTYGVAENFPVDDGHLPFPANGLGGPAPAFFSAQSSPVFSSSTSIGSDDYGSPILLRPISHFEPSYAFQEDFVSPAHSASRNWDCGVSSVSSSMSPSNQIQSFAHLRRTSSASSSSRSSDDIGGGEEYITSRFSECLAHPIPRVSHPRPSYLLSEPACETQPSFAWASQSPHSPSYELAIQRHIPERPSAPRSHNTYYVPQEKLALPPLYIPQHGFFSVSRQSPESPYLSANYCYPSSGTEQSPASSYTETSVEYLDNVAAYTYQPHTHYSY